MRRRRANEKEGKHEGEEEKEHTTDGRADGERESEYIGVSVDFLLEQQRDSSETSV